VTKISAKEKATQLRNEGYSYNLIAEKVGVSKSSLSLWLANVPYKPNQEVVARIGNARAAAGETKSRLKSASYKEAEQMARVDTGSLQLRDLFILGLALYIGEGQKNDTVGIVNADPRIIQTAIHWLQKCYGVPKENLTLAIHLYSDNNRTASLRYWSLETGIPLSQFGKTQIDLRANKRESKRGKLPHGTAHLRVRAMGNKEFGVLLARRIRASMDIVLKENLRV
jgi:transcriptional regulator with XRE-family HTH domain